MLQLADEGKIVKCMADAGQKWAAICQWGSSHRALHQRTAQIPAAQASHTARQCVCLWRQQKQQLRLSRVGASASQEHSRPGGSEILADQQDRAFTRLVQCAKQTSAAPQRQPNGVIVAEGQGLEHILEQSLSSLAIGAVCQSLLDQASLQSPKYEGPLLADALSKF